MYERLERVQGLSEADPKEQPPFPIEADCGLAAGTQRG
jgi:hypothetical protein